jgi:hypothetical protein
MDEKTIRVLAERFRVAADWSEDKLEEIVEAMKWLFDAITVFKGMRYKNNERAAWTQLYIAYAGTQNWGMLPSAEQTAAWVDQAIAERRKRYPAPGAEELAKPAEPETPAAS